MAGQARQAPGVVDGDDGAGVPQAQRHLQHGGVAQVVAVRLEGDAQDRHRPARGVGAQGVQGHPRHVVALPAVDGVDPVQERGEAVGAQFGGALLQPAQVLGQAAPAEADAGAQEAVADARVAPDGVGQHGDVGPRGVAQGGHGVDEADLRGEEGVGRRLDQFGGLVVHGQPGHVRLEDGGVDLVQDRAGPLGPRGVGRQAVDDAVGAQGVGHGQALAQELGVPHDQGAPGQAVGDPLGGAHRHGRLADHQRQLVQALARRQRRRQGVDRPPQVAQVRPAARRRLGRADGQEVDVGAGAARGAGRRGVVQAPLPGAPAQQLVQAGLVEGGLPAHQPLQARRVGLHAQDVVAQVGHGRGVDGSEVAAADHCQSHSALHPRVVVLFRARWVQAASQAPAPGRKTWTRARRRRAASV